MGLKGGRQTSRRRVPIVPTILQQYCIKSKLYLSINFNQENKFFFLFFFYVKEAPYLFLYLEELSIVEVSYSNSGCDIRTGRRYDADPCFWI